MNAIIMQDNTSTSTYNIGNLPSSALTHIASYLAVPSRALFAVALSVTSEESLAIVGRTQCDIIDVGEIHKDLAANLTDDDISNILRSVDAVNRVKRLILTGCVNITGAGLEPLRGSLVIEQIDLNIWAKHTFDRASILCCHVLPILDSIIENERCALKHLHVPYAWRHWKRVDPEFNRFLLRYNQMWTRRQELLSCMKCSAHLPQRRPDIDGRGPWVHDMGGPWMYTLADREEYGTQRHTCHGCLKHYCLNCRSDGSSRLLDHCTECERVYCADCSPVLECAQFGCGKRFCSGCALDARKCRDCGSVCCGNCLESCESCGAFCPKFTCAGYIQTCDYCDESMCSDCRSQSRSKETTMCAPSYERICNECRLDMALENGLVPNDDCECSSNSIAPLLMEHIKELTAKNEELSSKNKELTNDNNDLTNDNKQLRSKIKSLRKFEGNCDQEGM